MLFDEIVSREPIIKGWSGDEKYRVRTNGGAVYLLRVSPHDKKEGRKALFEMLKEVSLLGITMCEPIEIGMCDEGVYMLHSWVDGKDAEEVILEFTEADQYKLGIDAGESLKKIHSIPAPAKQEDWHTRFNRKTDYKIKKYRECGIRFKGDEHVINFLEKNRDIFKGRPQSFQHGDYHIGNMMIEGDKLVIIDFDRFDFGDPWEEFNRIVFCAQLAPNFARGMVDGYFSCEPPVEFWKCLAYYIGSNTLSSIYWAMDFGQKDLDIMLAQSQDVLSWYRQFTRVVPTWYK